ncbi:hypothetical protein [Arthrobacter citreus]|uniref:hypothetical protein n=1 Tax=Arthrobacter citreus TaxID=1670 RepID=UPI0038086B7A
MTASSALHISLSDVASLARVQRAVVSMWRTRFRSKERPFPAPVTQTGGQELFDAHEVAAWLVETGHGNNPQAQDDLAAFAVLADGRREDPLAFQALTSLLTLLAMSGEPFPHWDSEDLLDLADEHDPDDELLYRELEAVQADLPVLARFASELADAAFNPAAAFELLMANRFRAGLRSHTDTALTDEAVRLVAGIAVELASGLPETPLFADPSDGGSDLLLALAAALGDAADATLVTRSGGGETARLVRRRLRVHGISGRTLTVDPSGEFGIDGAAVHLAHYPSPGRPGMTPVEILTAVDQAVLQMDDRQRGVVLAPAAVLADVLPKGESREARAGLIREGRVRAVVRLPEGLLRSKPRQALALWVLGPAHPDVPIADRWTVVADLTGEKLDPGTVQDLISDLAASLGSQEQVRAHSFRFARPVLTRVILPGSTALTAASHAAPPVPAPRGAAAALRADQLLEGLSTGTSQDRLSRYSVEPAPDGGTRRRPRPLGSLVEEGLVKYVPGTRLAEGMAGVAGSVPIYGTPELLGTQPRGTRRMELLDFYAHVVDRRTEPGDIVFCTGPQAAAFVDAEGGAVVQYPARVLRVDKTKQSGLLPDLVAADINAQADTPGSWRRWPVRQIPADPGPEVLGFLLELDAQRARARARLKQLDELTTLVLDGVAGGTVTVTATDAPMEGNT